MKYISNDVLGLILQEININNHLPKHQERGTDIFIKVSLRGVL